MPTRVSDQSLDSIRIVEPLCAVFRRRLRDEGLKYTAERARILDAVMAMPGPFTVEELLARLKGGLPRVSKATAYRTVKLLADGGIVRPVVLNSDQTHYTLAYGRGSTATLVDATTGRMELVDVPGLAELCERLCAQRGLSLNGQSLMVYAAYKA
ncbi:MAG TPA: transcriptional repressor [Phycisphaerales bacterium]|nr:transcriptional repressor [Phycisphaerales bacterium]